MSRLRLPVEIKSGEVSGTRNFYHISNQRKLLERAGGDRANCHGEVRADNCGLVGTPHAFPRARFVCYTHGTFSETRCVQGESDQESELKLNLSEIADNLSEIADGES
jgi:hypothetical protein